MPVISSQVAICFDETGNDESGSPPPPPPEGGLNRGGAPMPPDTLSSVSTGMAETRPSLRQEERFEVRSRASHPERCNQTPSDAQPEARRRSFRDPWDTASPTPASLPARGCFP